ncbi:unnamed protein product [Haemonchus placei]|uniref:Cell division cycle protein 26 homolog n=1 Tax=Haemonchus placei TaxID=6290 RepID=A0A0N4VYF8_HAEPC|nr:unnamed protein product [Haemonchus placei]
MVVDSIRKERINEKREVEAEVFGKDTPEPSSKPSNILDRFRK